MTKTRKEKIKAKRNEIDLLLKICQADIGTVSTAVGVTHLGTMIRAFMDFVEMAL